MQGTSYTHNLFQTRLKQHHLLKTAQIMDPLLERVLVSVVWQLEGGNILHRQGGWVYHKKTNLISCLCEGRRRQLHIDFTHNVISHH